MVPPCIFTSVSCFTIPASPPPKTLPRILASPLIVAGIGYLLELLIPWPFNGFVSGVESFGWMLMFLGGRKLVLEAMQEKSDLERTARKL